ncbi:OTOF, partial [Symbiodinium sp. KB8]
MFVSWNEDNIWPDVELYPEEFESAYIEFTVYARNWFTRNYQIGKASLQLKSVNARTGHVYMKKSLPLRKEGETAATGEEVKEEGEAAEDLEDLSKAVLGASADTGDVGKYHVLVNIYRAEMLGEAVHTPMGSWNLAKIGGYNPNPFVTVEFSGVRTTPAYDVEQCHGIAVDVLEVYTWNECARIPVQTPVYEALICRCNELAQGLISFSELRNNSLPARWHLAVDGLLFCLYGWDTEEVPDVKQISKSGENIKPNFFKGIPALPEMARKLLISGRVERLGADETMMPAGITTARSAVEPRNMQLALLADVYEVSCEAIVNLRFVGPPAANVRSSTKETKDWVSPGGLDKIATIGVVHDYGEDDKIFDVEEVTTFSFTQDQGRIDPILTMAPEEAKSQPLVMVNVYTRGVLSGKVRVGYAMRFNMHARIPGSVLMVIEHFTTDDVPRHNRRTVKPMVYIVRAYVFMARNIKVDTAGANLALRVACAGISKTTEPEFGQVRPMWMKPLELRVTLCSDHPKDMQSVQIPGDNAFSRYMRQKDNMGRTQDTCPALNLGLKPQWVQLFGGNYGSVAMGEVLIGFELLHSKFRADLPAIHMYGLRDLIPMGGRSEEPLVNVRVKKFERPEEGAKRSKYYSMNFKYEKLVEEGQEDNKDDHLHKWKTDALGQQGCRNFEFFQVQKVNVMLPDKEILQPFMAIRVLEKPLGPMELFHGTALHLKPFGDEGTLVGESRQSLNLLYPCTWYEGVTDGQPYSYQENRIKRGVDRASRACASRTLYQEESAEEWVGNRLAGHPTAECKAPVKRSADVKSKISMEEEKAEKIDSRAMPLELRPYRATYNPKGYLPEVKEPLRVREEHALNMERLNLGVTFRSSFGKRFGERSNKDSDGSTGLRLRGKLEHSKQVHVFQPDFWYHNAPLMRNADIVDLSDETAPDWNFMHDKVFGFVKCVFKLMDGWEDLPQGDDEDHEQKHTEESDDEDEPVAVKDVEPVVAQSPVDTGAGVGLLDDSAALANVRADARKRSKTDDTQSAVVTDEDIAKLRRSVGFDDDLDSYAFDVAKLTSRFKNKAICIFGKQVEGFFGKAFIDPYLA